MLLQIFNYLWLINTKELTQNWENFCKILLIDIQSFNNLPIIRIRCNQCKGVKYHIQEKIHRLFLYMWNRETIQLTRNVRIPLDSEDGININYDDKYIKIIHLQ